MEIISRKNNVTVQYSINLFFNVFLEICLLDLFLIISNENLIPFTPKIIIQGTQINSLGSKMRELNNIPLSPKVFNMKPNVNPVTKPLMDTTIKINGIPIMVTPRNHKTVTNLILLNNDILRSSEVLIFWLPISCKKL